MRIENEVKLDYKDVLIRPKRSTLKSRSEVSLERTYVLRHAKDESGNVRKWTGVPVAVANMDTTGTFEMAAALAEFEVCTAIHKHYSVEDWVKFAGENRNALKYMFVSTGASESDFEKVNEILKALNAPELMIMLDVANGYSETFVAAVRRARECWPSSIICAGNVVTGEMTEELILSGADIVKVGIGPGSVCTTRTVTGVGYPQLSAVIECADAAHGLGAMIMADGGCTTPGDFSKAFGAGADFVMAGGMFAGHDESGGELITEPSGKKRKRFYGMSSAEAQRKHHGKVEEYRASEGKSVTVDYKGSVQNTIRQILGGIRSTCTYVGASSLKELSKRTTFVRVTQTVNNVFGTHLGTTQL